MSRSAASSSRDPVEQLAEAFLERYRRGERPSLSEYTQAYPELAEDIRDLFPALVEMEALKSPADDVTGPEAAPGSSIPTQLGDYRILREIGRGGMGVVYEAVQETLGRNVALKVLPREYVANPTYLKRFRREARSAAGLHHSNIVPIFGVGDHEGYHFFAMQLIRGQTLEAVLQEVRRLRRIDPDRESDELTEAARERAEIAHTLIQGKTVRHATPPGDTVTAIGSGPGDPHATTGAEIPSNDKAAGDSQPAAGAVLSSDTLAGQTDTRYYRSVARIGLQVAEALSYAHEQGILHRDIKPANILNDLDGTAWVADFGLAKLAGAEDLSTSRDIVGTLRFMAPERFDGWSDTRSDVYGLGVTMYELLTLRPAFDAADQPRLIRQIVSAAPTPPRKIDRHVPRDLETICMKAMAREPLERYATAGAMAEDLRRYLADRTILARRTTTEERLWRWCRRNKMIASLLSAVAALLVFIAAYSSVMAARYKVVAARYKQESLRANAAEAGGREKLFASYFAQARASRSSRRPGQRFAALRALSEAAKIHRTPELRDEAIAALALPDMKLFRQWPGADLSYAIDASFTLIATPSRDGTISVRRVNDDHEIQRIARPQSTGSGLIFGFSADGRHVVASHFTGNGSEQIIRVHRIGATEPIVIDRSPGIDSSADFSPDGRQIAIGHSDGAVRLYDLSTGRVQRCWREGAGVPSIRFSPNARQVAVLLSGTPRLLRVRYVATGEQTAEIRGPQALSIAWHPEGKAIAVNSDDKKVYLYSIPSGEVVSVLEHRNIGLTASFSPTGCLLATNGWERRTRVWNPFTGELNLSFPERGMLGFRRDGKQFAAATPDNQFALYDVAEGREYRTLVRQPGRLRQGMGKAALHPGGRLLAVAIDNGIGFWDVEHDVELGFLPIGRTTLAFSASGDLLTTWWSVGSYRWTVTAEDDRERVFRIGPPIRLPLPPGGTISESQDGRFVGVARSDGATLVDARAPNRPIALGPQNDARWISISPDGRWASTASHHTGDGVKVWSLPDGKLVYQVPNTSDVSSTLFSPDGRWLIANTSGFYRVRSTADWTGGPERVGTGLAFTPDSRLLAVDDLSGSIRLVEPASQKLVASLEDPNSNRAISAVITPDASRLIFTSMDSLSAHVWDLRSIRRQLGEIDLDWDWPRIPESEGAESPAEPLSLILDLGNLIEKLGRIAPLSIEQLTSALKITPANAGLLIQRGWACYGANKYKEAVGDFTRALALQPGDAQALAGRGESQLERHRFQDAAADFEASLARKPDQPAICNVLAWLYVTAPPPWRDPAKALPLAKRAVASAPNDANYHNTLGVVLTRIERFREAIVELEKSIAAAPRAHHAYDLYCLAICHCHLGDRARAKNCFERGCKAHSENPLPARMAGELDSFRAEAEALLGPATKG